MKFTMGEYNLANEFDLDLSLYKEIPLWPVQNHFTKETIMLNNLGLKLYNNIMNKYEAYERGESGAVRFYDRLKYLFAKMFPKEYMKLID